MYSMEQKLDLLLRYTVEKDKAVKKRLLEEIVDIVESDNYEPDIDDVTHELLDEIGIPNSLTGRAYVEYAVKLVVTKQCSTFKMNHNLYPTVALKFNTTDSRAERAIRHAIEVVANRRGSDDIAHLIGCAINPCTGKVTNSEFIAGCASTVRMRMGGIV